MDIRSIFPAKQYSPKHPFPSYGGASPRTVYLRGHAHRAGALLVVWLTVDALL